MYVWYCHVQLKTHYSRGVLLFFEWVIFQTKVLKKLQRWRKQCTSRGWGKLPLERLRSSRWTAVWFTLKYSFSALMSHKGFKLERQWRTTGYLGGGCVTSGFLNIHFISSWCFYGETVARGWREIICLGIARFYAFCELFIPNNCLGE